MPLQFISYLLELFFQVKNTSLESSSTQPPFQHAFAFDGVERDKTNNSVLSLQSLALTIYDFKDTFYTHLPAN